MSSDVEQAGSQNQSANVIHVGVADAATATGDTILKTSGLGSCVAIAFITPTDVGALLHAMLPSADTDNDTVMKYVDTGIAAVIDDLRAHTSRNSTITAKIVGGSNMLDMGSNSIGDRNVRAARAGLDEHGISIAGEDTGGDAGRTVQFDVPSGRLVIETAHTATNTVL